MPQHRIRLRAAWTIRGEAAGPDRIDLPAEGLPHLGERLQLTRRFRSPRIDPARETLAIELRRIPGLRRISLNGERLVEVPEGASELAVPLPELGPGANSLVLEVDREPAGGGAWGEVALVIEAR
jgi:hypothetical protein